MRIFFLVFALLLPGCVIGGDAQNGAGTAGVSRADTTNLRTFIFGHSLINHVSASSETNVPIWMNALARRAGLRYAVDGQFGFLRSHANLPPVAQWGFQGVQGAWNSDTTPFGSANFNSVMLTPANFIQDQPSTTNYWDGNSSPMDATLTIIDWVQAQEPGIPVYIYENWPDMAPFMSSGLAAYNDYTRNGFHQWWVDYTDEITAARPNVDVRLIPVGSTIARLLSDTALSRIPRDTLYEDDAPHGRPTIYFLAALVSYTAMYGERPPADFTVPGSIHSLVRDNYAEIIEIIWDELGMAG